MSSEKNPVFSWANAVAAVKWVAAIAIIGFSGGGGIAMVNAFIAFGEMKNEVRRQGDSLANVNEKLVILNQNISDFRVSQVQVAEQMISLDKFVRFALNDKGGDSASLDGEESAKNIPAGMFM